MKLNPHRVKQAKTLAKLLTTSRLLQKASVKMIHNLSHDEWGHDFLVEPSDSGIRGYLRGSGGNIQPGDHLILFDGLTTVRYQVDDIKLIANHSQRWVAHLSPCLA